MIRAVLIDDEKNATEVLALQLARHCADVEIVSTCNSAKAGIEAIVALKPDLVFLDIEMPHKNGFDVLEETKETTFEIIFTTAYNRFAIQAFKVSAVDYLLKPIDVDELKMAVEKVRKKKGSSAIDEKIKELLLQLQPTAKVSNKIALPIGEAMQFIDASDIIRCESESNYTHVFLANGKKTTVAKTLKEVEENLGGKPFFRVHQSHLVNVDFINKFFKGDNAYVIMKDGTQISISRNRKDAFIESFRKI